MFVPELMPAYLSLSSGALTEGMRPVIIPADISGSFERLASNNTRRDIETCGILAGKLVRMQRTALELHILHTVIMLHYLSRNEHTVYVQSTLK